MPERAVRAHDALDQRALHAQRRGGVVGRYDMGEVEMREGNAAARPADLVEASGDLPPIGDDAGVGAGGAGDPAIGAAADALQHGRRDGLGVGRQIGLDLRSAGDPELWLGR